MTVMQRNVDLPLNDRKSIEKHSQLYQLVPVLDEDGLLRQYGRIGAVPGVSRNMRCPVILPKTHWVTKLLVEKYHRKYRHANAETIVNETRQVYAISNLRPLVKKVVRGCLLGRLRKARPSIPPMAPLPAARLAVHARPFTNTGLDYFGLFSPRSSIQFVNIVLYVLRATLRWTARISRRIHYGQRKERLLREQISQGLSSTFTNSATKWTFISPFIPPGAPHMGGAWERLVQSVKRVMKTLTPNHFIMGSSSGASRCNQVPNHSQSAHRLKDMHEYIQLKLDPFWHRWIVEYLPVIRRQPKWFEEVRQLREGDLVLIVNDGERNSWVRGRVEQTTAGVDGRVRQAMVRTSGGCTRGRMSAELAALPANYRMRTEQQGVPLV
ncbi:uncharacterized protein LOC134288290 [Aedes albopictus]|uniref:DUF5641 domain-containing protein n=1 Tax=Aedes albopictus TaxID=7160 RepID=A0ABM1Z5Z2_AEDAL